MTLIKQVNMESTNFRNGQELLNQEWGFSSAGTLWSYLRQSESDTDRLVAIKIIEQIEIVI